MKKITSILILLLLLNCWAAPVTTFTYQFNNPDGSIQTNAALMTPWPPASANVVIVGTNIVWGATNVALVPNAAGSGTNSVMPNNYKVTIPALNIGFLVNIPYTTNILPLTSYAVSTPVVYPMASMYSLITNALGGAVVLSNYSSVSGALGFIAATNSYSATTNLLGFAPAPATFAGITAALGFAPATNTYNALTNMLGYVPATNTQAGIFAAMKYTPASNTLAGITFAQGYQSATNTTAGALALIGYTPMVNTASAITNTLGFFPATNSPAGILAALQYTPATNSLLGISNALGFVPAQQPGVLLTTNIAFLDGNTNLGTIFVTNSTVQGVYTP